VAGGLAVGLGIRQVLKRPRPGPDPDDPALLGWVRVERDNAVVIRIAQSEMGQGASTALAQLIAEEMDIDWTRVRTEHISLARHVRFSRYYGRTDTAESRGVRESQRMLRVAGAQIRAMLLAAAGKKLNAPVSELQTSQSKISHPSSGRVLTYGEVAEAAASIDPPDPDDLQLRDRKDWTLIGQPVGRMDARAKVDGSATFGMDIVLPGMKYAAVSMCPVFGGSLKSFDRDVALRRRGVHAVVAFKGGEAGGVRHMSDGVAVVADNWWRAKTALEAMPITWDEGPFASATTESLENELAAGLSAKPELVLRNDGDVDAALAAAATRLEADYHVPFLEHATMETMNCTALVTDDKFEVWAPTQKPEDALEIAAEMSGLPIESGEVHVPLLGCGFGRRQWNDYVSQAVQIARQVKGVPVKVLWSREETTRRGYYRPAVTSRLRAGLDGRGTLTAWSHRISANAKRPEYATYGSDSLLYAVPNMRVDLAVTPTAMPLGVYRSVAFGPNCFFTQSFTDEIARASGADPSQVLRALLDPARAPKTVPPGALLDDLTPAVRAARLRNVLDEVVRRAAWSKPLGRHRGRGIAVEEEASAYFACVAEVTLDGDGWFRVDRVVIAADVGIVVNPALAAAQIQGGVAFGLSAALYGRITVDKGRVVESNFTDMKMLTLADMPKVECHFVGDSDTWGGVGEPATAVIAPAVANAVYDAGGPRIRRLPFSGQDIRPR
jgi:isoquinoline 1-oxidoreductase beta subunit